MYWTAYEFFSVISGLILLAWALLDDGGDDEEVTPAVRAIGGLSGVAFIAYGFYVANQTSGVWTFPAFIFVLPIVAIWRLFVRFVAVVDETETAVVDETEETDEVIVDPEREAERAALEEQYRSSPMAGSQVTAAGVVPTFDGRPPGEPPAAARLEDTSVTGATSVQAVEVDTDPPPRRVADALPASSPVPGWYPDPDGDALLRWWDGSAWSEHTKPRA